MLVPARREIWVDAREAAESPARRRFTIAHEIGHWVCQVREGRGAEILCRPDPSLARRADPREREANVFAAELLMPAGEVRRLAAEGFAVAELAGRFEVSGPAMAWRLFNLGLGPRPA
jgi:Zn-dependent peptidase ImmA (M78 family)